VTRRILLALIALTMAILAGAVIPLALQAVAHEQDAFVSAAEDTARSIAVVAADKIGNNANSHGSASLSTAVRIAARQGDELLVLNEDNQALAHYGVPQSDWKPYARNAQQSGTVSQGMDKYRVIVAEPVWDEDRLQGTPVGLIVLERPLGQLNQQITNLWLYLALLAGAALLAAAAIAVTFARWVNRPLAKMDNAARRLADGNLTVRAVTGSGPPELRRMAASFNMMAGRLETLVHGHRVMLADVSHQLRTPLAALRLRLDLLAADSGPTAASELAGAQEEIARLSRLVDGLLAVARAESVSEQIVSLTLAPAVAERVTAWQPVADAHDVKLRVQLSDGEGVQISLGAGHLEQILDNLLANAIDVLPDGGSVNVSVAKSDAGVTLSVADDGPGMSAQERSRAFLRFVSGSKNGTGLGLAIVHRLVTSNGGTARLEETPGGGLTVVMNFPESVS
jgi:signal transduction histidine kinase